MIGWVTNVNECKLAWNGDEEELKGSQESSHFFAEQSEQLKQPGSGAPGDHFQ